MKYIYRVARREFGENASTKGFWIGIFLFPIMILVSIEVTGYLATATPTRHYILLDQSGTYTDTIQEGLEELDDRALLQAQLKFIEETQVSEESRPEINFDDLPADVFQRDPSEEAVQQVRLQLQAMGLRGLADDIKVKGLTQAVDFWIKQQDEEFESPRRKFKKVDLPPGIDKNADLDTIANDLRPYLTGAKTYEVDGEEIELFAAILLPKNVDSHVNRFPVDPKPEDADSAPSPDDGDEQAQEGDDPETEGDQATEDGDEQVTEGENEQTTDGEGTTRKGIQYWSSNPSDDELKRQVARVVDKALRAEEATRRNLTDNDVKAVQNTSMPISALNPRKETGKEEITLGDKIRNQWGPMAFVYLLWVGIFTISQMLLNNTIEEKSNRIIEVLLSSVTTGELMMGKLFGIASVGITMLVSWIASLFVILKLKANDQTAEFANAALEVMMESGLLPWFAVYFILGYFMYSGVFLAIGSVCNTLKEAQNLMGPVMLIMAVPLFTMMFIPKDPNGVLATTLSWVPLYTPFIMMNRVEADPPPFDTYGTLILLIATTLFTLWLCGRIFRTGILRTGQPPKIAELWRWIRSAN